MITIRRKKVSRVSIVEAAPKDKLLERTLLSIRTISSSGIVRPKARIPTKMCMKSVISTNLTHPAITKTNSQPITTKISPWPKTLPLTTKTLDSLPRFKNQALQKDKTTNTNLILILPINPLKLALLHSEAPLELNIDKLFPATDNRRQTVSMIPPIDIKCPIHRFSVLLKRTDTLIQLKMHPQETCSNKNFTKGSKIY